MFHPVTYKLADVRNHDWPNSGKGGQSWACRVGERGREDNKDGGGCDMLKVESGVADSANCKPYNLTR